MSQVISFRLDRNNPREAQALGVLKKGQEVGYSVRHILTEALLALEAVAEDERAVLVTLAKMTERLAEVQSMLEQIQGMDFSAAQVQETIFEKPALAQSFLLSVKSAAKPGITLASE